MGGPGLSRCMDPIKNGDIPASYVSLPKGIFQKGDLQIGARRGPAWSSVPHS